MITTSTEKNKSQNRKNRIDNMEEVLRGEMSAVEAYEQVIEKIDETPEVIHLRELLINHREAVSYWKRQVRTEHATPDNFSGTWGVFVETFVGVAKLLGSTATLKALKEGEEHGLSQYENLLEDESASLVNKNYIRNVLIPNQKRHISTIEAMVKIQ